jgi:hypothetical protein
VRGDLLADLTSLGGTPVYSRLVWIFDPKDPSSWAHRNLRRDLRLLDRAELRPATREDVPRILELYRKLYLDRYSRLNPDLTPALLDRLVGDGLLETHVVVRDGRVDAVNGFFVRDGVLTSPLLGWDTEVPQTAGLYRIACALTLRLCGERGLILHKSAGVGRFKRQRGAKPATEFHVAFTDHLGPAARAAWAVLAAAGRGAAPIIERIEQ